MARPCVCAVPSPLPRGRAVEWLERRVGVRVSRTCFLLSCCRSVSGHWAHWSSSRPAAAPQALASAPSMSLFGKEQGSGRQDSRLCQAAPGRALPR